MENKISKRNYTMDNIKAILIFAVVLGHTLRYIPGEISRIIYILIYTFHMPIFCFITGYFSKKNKSNFKIIVYYIIFETLYVLFDNYLFGMKKRINIMQPYWLTWYLFAIIIWKYSLKLLDRKSKKVNTLLLLAITVISVLCGYVNNIGSKFCLSRILVFFPYFLLGYYIKNKKIEIISSEKIKNIGNRIKNIELKKTLESKESMELIKNSIFFTVILIYTMVIIKNAMYINPKIYYGNNSYEKYGYSFVFRIIIILLNLMMISLLLKFIPNKKIKGISNIGKNTMIVYLLHGFIIRYLYAIKIFKYSDLINTLLAIIISVLIVSCMVLIKRILSKEIEKIKKEFKISIRVINKLKSITAIRQQKIE